MYTTPMLSAIPSSLRYAAPGMPRIRANRQQLDDRFPVLGFTVDTAGLAFYEVVLTIDPQLFDPARAAERTVDNFYSSRADSGLIDAEATVYTVPTAVIRRFASSRAIYYTLVCYADRNLSNATAAHDGDTLAHNAPSVAIAPGFEGRTLTSMLAVPAEFLCTVRNDGTTSAAAVDADEDRGEGEDGAYADAAAVSYDDSEDHEPELVSESYVDQEEDGAESPEESDEPASAYDDGFGDLPAATYSSAASSDGSSYDDTAEAAASTFPSDSSAPGMLEDEDYREPDSDDEHGYAEQYGAGAGDSSAMPGMPPAPFDVPAKRKLLERVLQVAGPPDGFATALADAEFNGQLGEHPARGKYHLGLSYGIALFNQDMGDLGLLLTMMQQRAAAKFREVFGSNADELVRVTNVAGVSSAYAAGGRGPRVQPVGGEDLWGPGWLARFREAARADLFGPGQPQLFNGAQNELAVNLYLEPMLPLARILGIKSARGLGLLFDRALQMGRHRALDWVIGAISPIQTPAQRQQVLAALGHTSVAGFQRAHGGLESDGEWGPLTHAAVLAGLRALGARSPVPVPQHEQEWHAMLVRRSSGEPWQDRIQRVADALDTTEYVC